VGAIIGWFAGQILKERKQTVIIEPVKEVLLSE
jgi:uncharacterized membrane protein YeaQ/YmgE (transglycosylase-associated protein family)